MKQGCALNILAFSVAISIGMAKSYGLSKERFIELYTEVTNQCFERFQ
jgi:hypothetical protein